MRILTAVAVLALATAAASARLAHCDTTDDGAYACDFKALDHNGSFIVTARDKPDYTIIVSDKGVGEGFVNLGPRNISLAGPFRLDPNGSGCWISDLTPPARICAK